MQTARQALNPDSATATGLREALQGRDVIIISPQFWGDYWVSKHWIAHELARHVRVFFIEPTLWVGSLLRKPWANRGHLTRMLKPVRQLENGVHVLSPRFFRASAMKSS